MNNNNNFIIIIFLILFFLNLNFEISNAIKYNVTKLNNYRFLKYTNNDCTGPLEAFLNFYEHKIYSEFLKMEIDCDQSIKRCKFYTAYDNDTTYYNFNECYGSYVMKYDDPSNFDYDESKFCAVSEYSTPRCEYKPVITYGSLNNVCVSNVFITCSTILVTVHFCYKNVTNQHVDVFPDNFLRQPTYFCSNSLDRSSTARGYQGHASTVDGVIDPDISRVYKLGPPSNKLFSSLSSSTSSFSILKINLTLIIILIILLINL